MASSDRRRLPLLPHELLLGIVDRIPIGQLKVLRLLNKEWYKYLTQRLQPYTSEVFLRTNPEDQTVVEIFKRDIINQEVAHSRFPLEIPPELPGPVESIIDCDGLLLCKCKNLEPGRSEYPHLAIWNPVLKSARLIDPMDGSKALFNYGFGYELTSPLNYKILRIPRWTPPTPSYPVRGRPVEIYSFRTQTWKPHTADCDNWPEPIPKNIGLCVKGTMYWWFEKIALVSFDFSRERFKRHFGPCSLDMYKPVLGSFPGGKLSLLGAEHYHDSDLHVWVSNELGCDNVVAFAKYSTLPCNQIISMFGLDYFRSLPIKVVRPAFSFVDNTVKSVIVAAENADNIFIEDSDRLFIFYKIDELGVITPCEIGRGDYSTDPVAYVYFPSRVPLPSPSPQLVTLPELLPYNALEPVFSAETLQTHFQLHKDYVITHNNALDNLYRAVLMEDRSAETTKWQSIIDFNAAGDENHSIFWGNLAPVNEGGGDRPKGSLGDAIDTDFGSYEGLTDKMIAEGAAMQGSGWVWLGLDRELKKLVVDTTANEDPLVTKGESLVPLLGIDVWEHAYDSQYKNKRSEYLKNVWQVISWIYATQVYEKECK